MNKKADVPWVLIGMILALITLVVILAIAYNPFTFAKTTFQSQISEQKARLCAVQGKQAEILPPDRRPPDADKDGYPDSCDFCWNGDDGRDVKPADGFPDDCQNPTVMMKQGDDITKTCNNAPRCTKHDCWDKQNKVCKLPLKA